MMGAKVELSVIGLACLVSCSLGYYDAQFAQVAPLQPNRDVCVNMIPPYVGSRKPLRNRYHLKLEMDAQWISFKRISISAYSAPDRYQAFSGMMVQITLNNLPIGEFESDNRIEIADCPPGKRNLACLRTSSKLLQAAVNWAAPPEFDVYTKELNCVVTVIGLNQKYWTVSFMIKPAPFKYPEYGNFTSDIKPDDQQPQDQ